MHSESTLPQHRSPFVDRGEDTEIIRMLEGLCDVNLGIFGSVLERATLISLRVLARDGDRPFMLLRFWP